jgi:hypothetical protein
MQVTPVEMQQCSTPASAKECSAGDDTKDSLQGILSMHCRVASTLFISALMAATATVAQPVVSDQFPHIPMMSHQKMTQNGKVIYEADVDLNDPKRKPFVLRVKVDDLTSDCASVTGTVASSASQEGSPGHNASSAYMVSCVVTELSSDGQAKADVIYSIQDETRNIHKSGHVRAGLQAGKVYKTSTNDSQVSLLLQTY